MLLQSFLPREKGNFSPGFFQEVLIFFQDILDFFRLKYQQNSSGKTRSLTGGYCWCLSASMVAT